MEPNSKKPSQEPTPMAPTDKKAHRRTREVSSRYMTSPSMATPKNPSFPQHHAFDSESEQFADENAVAQSSETSMPLGIRSKAIGTQRRQQIRLFTDNAIEELHSRKTRPGTPMVGMTNSKKVSAKESESELLTLLQDNRLCPNEDSGIGSVETLPESDLLPTTSVRRSRNWGLERKETTGDSLCRGSTSRLAMSSSQQLPIDQNKPIRRPFASLKPPKPPNTKSGIELGKGRKLSNRQEDVHLLRLLENRYLQWRFVNAKAQVVDHARRIATEKSVYDVLAKLPELRYSVTMKRIELEQWRRTKSLATIVEAQMPYLDEWTSLEGDYSTSLSGATKALHDASLRLPIIGSVKADISELKEILESVVNMFEGLSPYVDRFLTKAEGMDNVISELARVVGREKALTEECGDLLSVAHELQVKECSLRCQLIQTKQSSVK